MKDKALLQLRMIKKILDSSKKNSFIIVDLPIIDIDVIKVLDEINCSKLLFFERVVKQEVAVEDVVLLLDKAIDLYDDNSIFELCNNCSSHITIKEMKELLKRKHFDYRFYE